MGIPFDCCGLRCCGSGKQHQDAHVGQEEIAAVYDRIAPLYDIWGRLTETRARDRAITLADIRDGQSILEVAVGTGIAFGEILKRNPNGTTIGIDLSEGMLARARKRARRFAATTYSLEIGSAFQLAVGDETIDTLVNNYMFDLIPFEEMDTIIVEFKRVLKDGGKLVLVNMTEGERFGSRFYDRIYQISPKTMGGCRGVCLTDRLQRNGFTVAQREYYQQMLFPSEVILAFK